MNYTLEEKEIFSLLTPKQVSEISDIAMVNNFTENDIVYNQNELASNLYILLEGEVVLALPSSLDAAPESYSLEIDRVKDHGIFGPGLLFGIERYSTRATAAKTSKIMIFDSKQFLEIIRENKSEFPIMAYIARVYFQRYINSMKQFALTMQERSSASV